MIAMGFCAPVLPSASCRTMICGVATCKLAEFAVLMRRTRCSNIGSIARRVDRVNSLLVIIDRSGVDYLDQSAQGIVAIGNRLGCKAGTDRYDHADRDDRHYKDDSHNLLPVAHRQSITQSRTLQVTISIQNGLTEVPRSESWAFDYVRVDGIALVDDR